MLGDANGEMPHERAPMDCWPKKEERRGCGRPYTIGGAGV